MIGMGDLKPGEVNHRCADCSRCSCDDSRCGAICDWDCDCPAYFAPEERP